LVGSKKMNNSKTSASLDNICFGTFKKKDAKISYEFFPPKNLEDENNLIKTIEDLSQFKPEFVSVTYGAGGSTQETSLNLIKKILERTNSQVVAHLTCVGSSKEDVLTVAKKLLSIGVNKILALRGDMPNGERFKPHPQGFSNSTELIYALKKIHNFDISVACFPETHPEAESEESDIFYFKQKMQAGASQAISQYFFNPEVFLAFQKKCLAQKITIPIIPGIILPTNIKQLKRFSKMCSASIPNWVEKIYKEYEENEHLTGQNQLSLLVAYEQIRILKENGVNHFHLYTLNKYETASNISRIIRLFN